MALTNDEQQNARLFADEDETCVVLKVPPRKLQRWRVEGDGPPFYKFGQSIRYKIPEVLEWASTQRQLTTTGHRRPHPPAPEVTETPTVSASAPEQAPKKRGWPKGRPRGPRKPPAATSASAE